jgi:hypothetical protein
MLNPLMTRAHLDLEVPSGTPLRSAVSGAVLSRLGVNHDQVGRGDASGYVRNTSNSDRDFRAFGDRREPS